MKSALLGLWSLVLVSCATTRSDNTAAPTLSWEYVRENAASMDGRDISMCGWFRAEFEVCTLAPDPYGDPASAAATEIWLAPKSDVCGLEKVTSQPTKGWADVSGTFQHSSDPSKGYGIFGLNRSAIGNAVVRMRSKSCDK